MSVTYVVQVDVDCSPEQESKVIEAVTRHNFLLARNIDPCTWGGMRLFIVMSVSSDKQHEQLRKHTESVTYYIWALLKTKCAVEFKYHVNEDVPEFHYDKDGRLTEEYEYDIDGFPVPH